MLVSDDPLHIIFLNKLRKENKTIKTDRPVISTRKIFLGK